jgi:hypothetical protein
MFFPATTREEVEGLDPETMIRVYFPVKDGSQSSASCKVKDFLSGAIHKEIAYVEEQLAKTYALSEEEKLKLDLTAAMYAAKTRNELIDTPWSQHGKEIEGKLWQARQTTRFLAHFLRACGYPRLYDSMNRNPW